MLTLKHGQKTTGFEYKASYRADVAQRYSAYKKRLYINIFAAFLRRRNDCDPIRPLNCVATCATSSTLKV
jgi:hypothetical protein